MRAPATNAPHRLEFWVLFHRSLEMHGHCGASLIPTKGNSKIRSTVDGNVNVSEYALIYNEAPMTLNQRVQGSNPCAPTIRADSGHVEA